jgi:hypothetical protein
VEAGMAKSRMEGVHIAKQLSGSVIALLRNQQSEDPDKADVYVLKNRGTSLQMGLGLFIINTVNIQASRKTRILSILPGKNL